MKRLLCLLALFAAWVGSAAAQGPTYTDLYPLKKGHRWIYRVTDAKAAEARKVTIEVEREEPYTRMVKKDKALVKETHTGYLVKATSGGKTTHDHVVALEEGIVRVHAAGTPVTPPILFFKLPPKAGDTWDWNPLNGNGATKGTFTTKIEKIGTYDAFVVSYREPNSPEEIDYWFVRGIGMLKQRVKTKNSEVVLELESINFTPAK